MKFDKTVASARATSHLMLDGSAPGRQSSPDLRSLDQGLLFWLLNVVSEPVQVLFNGIVLVLTLVILKEQAL